MLFTILLLLKVLLFMNITKVEHNRAIVFLVSTLVTLFIFTLIYLSNNKKKQTIAFSFYNILSIIMFADVMYYSFFNTLPSIKMLKQLHQVSAVGDSVVALLSSRNLLFLLDIPFLIKYSKWKKEKIEEENKDYDNYIKWGVPVSLVFILVLFINYIKINDLFLPVINQEIYSYHIRDIVEAFSDDGTVKARGIFTQEDLEELKNRTSLKEGKHTGIGNGKNLIVIQVEALQDFPLNRFYYGQEITPNLNKFIKEQGSLYFDNYYQQIGRGNTSDAEFVSNNSLYPSMDEPTYSQYEGNTFYGLPWVLKDNGYTSWVFHGYKPEFWNRSAAYPKQGFERFISEEDYDLKETIGFGITDEEFFKQSMDYLKELDNIDDNPFHAFMITLTSHTPFKMPSEYQYLEIREEHKDTILGDYLQSIHYTDKAIGDFFEQLKEEGLYEDTVIALYGDHFAITGLNDSGIELMTEFLGKPYDIDEMFKIPLIIHVPGENINETISKVGSQLDFTPTILNIMGYENEKGIMFGRDLINYDGYNYVAPQTYILKGSFIDEEVLFFMSRDGIFENCTAKDKKTKEKIDVEPLREKYESIIADVNKSDYVLKMDLIKHIIENDGQIDVEHLTVSSILKAEHIVDCSIDPMKDLENSYEEGYRLMSVVLKWKDNETIVLQEESNVEYNIEDLVKWMKRRKDACIILRTKELDESIFLKVKDDYPEFKDRFVVEMKDFEQHILLSNKAYKNIILGLSDTEYNEDEIIDFLERNPLFGVIMDKKLAKTSLRKKLQKMGTKTYIERQDIKTCNILHIDVN